MRQVISELKVHLKRQVFAARKVHLRIRRAGKTPEGLHGSLSKR